MSKIYFPNLNGLRAIAASIVIMHHVEQFKSFLGLPNHKSEPFVELIGKAGVTLFFVLSGFLITYLLLSEEQQKGRISIWKFYCKRALRIWPLYFFIVALSFFVFPHLPFLHIDGLTDQLRDNFWAKLALYLFFLPNLVLALFPIVPFASQAWSIGYEEQFYLVWPWLISKIKKRDYIFFTIIVAMLLLKFLMLYVFRGSLADANYLKAAEVFFSMPGIDCMAIGGAFAYLLFRRKPILTFFFSKPFQWLLYTVTLTLVCNGIFIPLVSHQAYSVLFGLIILNLAANKDSIVSLENKTLNYLGQISYGIYMYHILAVVIVLKFFTAFAIQNVILENLAAISLTVVVAGLSYKYLEEPFIRMKSKF
jgi:peptidoglycan/LPS O-acetylase OafA/YrhL